MFALHLMPGRRNLGTVSCPEGYTIWESGQICVTLGVDQFFVALKCEDLGGVIGGRTNFRRAVIGKLA